MYHQQFNKKIIMFLWLFIQFQPGLIFSKEENFLLINGNTQEIIKELGPSIHVRKSPCSTFKIVLSLMGYDSEILIDKENPIWDFHEGYDDFSDFWKTSQTPQSWIKYSCVWYSKILVEKLKFEKFEYYITLFEYGNQNLKGYNNTDPNRTVPWINSSLEISPKEQVNFIRRLILEDLAVSKYSIEMTKSLLFVDDLSEGWKLYGKTGWGGSVKNEDKLNPAFNQELAWFVGWVENGETFYPFAFNISDKKIDLSQRIPRVKQLLIESNLKKL